MNPTIKPVFKCQTPVQSQGFARSKCLLTISVGQEVHEGEKFRATVDLVNDSFAACILLIDDSLQRHSMALDKPQEADFFYEQSITAGDAWLLRNKPVYERLTIPTEIIRWDRWLNHPQYLTQQQKIMTTLMTANQNYALSFDATVEEFIRRYYLRLSLKTDFDLDRAKKLCLDYLVEECTALCLWVELGCEFEVYPGRRNLAMQETHQRFVLPAYPNLLHAVWIKFKHRKQLKPQQFECEMIGS